MKPRLLHRAVATLFLCLFSSVLNGSTALLFEDDFTHGIPGWTAVQPTAAYLDGPLLWQYDLVSGSFVEQSNLYTDASAASPTAIAPMLINSTVTPASFSFAARLTAGDDDGFGLVFGYQNETNFYRVSFARQSRTGFPWTGWAVDRKVNGATANLFGAGTPGYTQTFVNAANRPFDVSLAVDAQNRFSLTVVDNPSANPSNYALVVSQPLPATAAGRVGWMTWGMSGGTPRGFRIQNAILSPLPLAANPNGLTNWTPVVPPRANGSTTLTGGTGQPFWSLGTGANGPVSGLTEESDSYGGNDAAGQIDFTGPALVAGDAAWDNYTFSARITAGDDDAQGVLLRYRNPTNFYRIALRTQASSIGPPAGLSVQKCLNRTYTEISREAAPQFTPSPGVPYDLLAFISGSQLEILLVNEPDTNPRSYTYGPFSISGLNTGKIGLFSWAMSQCKFQKISVHGGTPLYVSSIFGYPMPPQGLTGYTPGSVITLSAGDPITNVPGVRRWPIGWKGSGSAPPSGVGSNVTFTINALSHLEWLWQTEYRLSVTNEPGGAVSVPPGEWFAEGAEIVISAIPDSGFAFSGWSGDLVSRAHDLRLRLDRPLSLTANFTSDIDHDGLPDDWETAWFGTLDHSALDDPDRDGRSNAQEFESGTSPAVPDTFKIADLRLLNGQAVLAISNTTGSRYDIQRTTNLANWSTIATTQFATVFTSAVPVADQTFWRLAQPAPTPDVLPFVPGSWSLVVLPDTQVYSESYPEFFKDQARWILANHDRYQIKYVLQLGDIVNVPTATAQWNNAKAALSMLDGQVPYAFVPGNHDYGSSGVASDRTTLLNNYFPVSNYTNWPTFGGAMQPASMENTYHLFNAGGVDWLVLALEWGPRNSAVAWANQIATSHPAHRLILITHAYTYSDDTRYDWVTRGGTQGWNPYAYQTASDPDGTNDGEDLWSKLVNLHSNFTFVFNGHVLNDGLGRLSSTNQAGNVVHQLLVNYQMQHWGGEAYLRILEFLPDGKTVQVKAFSPLLNTFKTDSQNQFTLTLTPPLK